MIDDIWYKSWVIIDFYYYFYCFFYEKGWRVNHKEAKAWGLWGWPHLRKGYINDYIGGFGKVKVAKNKKTGKYVALKLLNKHEIMKAQQIDHVYN